MEKRTFRQALRLSRFMTNIKDGFAPFIEQAANETGFDVFVRQSAYTARGLSLPEFVAVWTNEPVGRDHGEFWKRYFELKADAGYRVPKWGK